MALKLSLLIMIIVGFVFLPTTIFLIFGMMPTIAAFSMDRSVGKSKTVCVGAMNFAGCFPFILKFWTEFGQQTIENAFRLVADVQTILVIYILAAGGYAIDKAVTGITATIIVQRAESRLKKIRKEQKKLVSKWGEKVTGKYKLDDYGFPVDAIPTEAIEIETESEEKEKPNTNKE